MKTDLPFSRRRLLARIPAVAAAAAVPATAVTLPGLASAVPDHLDGQQVRGLAEMLAELNTLPKGEANKILTAITEVLKCSMQTHAHDAELLALKPRFDAMFDDWWQRIEAGRQHLREFDAGLERRTGLTRAQSNKLERNSPEFEAYRSASLALSEETETPSSRSDEEVDRDADKEYALIDEILSYSPLTRDGLRLQCRALIMDSYHDWSDGVAQFLGSVVLFFRIKLPNRLAAELLSIGRDWDDEDVDEDEEGDEDEEDGTPQPAA